MSRPYDFLIVGAGFAGSVLAERLASESGKEVLLVDKRSHIGGNAYDEHDGSGLLVHRYGPHIFHTNSEEVFNYLSMFTEWRPYQHKVVASVDGQLVPIPINLDTLNALYGLNLTSEQAARYLDGVSEKRDPILTSEDAVVSKVGIDLYKKFFRNYTRKQWGLDPSELDAQVAARIPVRTNRDARYFTDSFQSMPLHGFTRLFERMLNHPRIHVLLQTDYQSILGRIPYKELIFTGPIDELITGLEGFPYRSLEFRHETHDMEQFQRAPVVNYPNDYAYTRVTEFKHLTGQRHPKTSIVYEYPRDEGDPYYPIPKGENNALYARYQALGQETPGVRFAGRLGTYRYYNMDQVVAQALTLYRKIAQSSCGSQDNGALHNGKPKPRRALAKKS